MPWTYKSLIYISLKFLEFLLGIHNSDIVALIKICSYEDMYALCSLNVFLHK